MAAPITFSLDLFLEDPAKAGELGVHNEPYEVNRRVIQTEELPSNVVFKTELQKISYGHLPDKTPAAVIVLQSQFHFTDRNRIKHAVIRLAFADTIEATKPDKAPRIIKIAPLHSQGRPAVQKTSSSSSITTSLRIPFSVPSISLSKVMTTERHKTRHAKIQGIVMSHHKDEYPTIENRARWEVVENDVEKGGIPPFFRAAILVQYEREFQMAVEVDVVQGFANSAREFLRKSIRMKDMDDPVRFTPGKPYPPDARTGEDFGNIDIDELVQPIEPTTIPGI